MKQYYELVYLLRLSVTPEQATEVQKQIEAIIAQHEGTIAKFGEFGKRKLAFSIDHETHANYWLAEFEVATEAVKELHRILTLEGRVLRFLITATRPKTEEDIERERRMKESIEKSEMKERQTQRERVKEKEKEKERKEAPAPKAESAKKKEQEKISLEELDQKLEELLDDESLKD